MHFQFVSLAVLFSLIAAGTVGSSAEVEDATQIEQRLSRTTRYLADDRLAGRGVGTPEIDVAADYLRQHFEQLGMAVEYQPFTFTRRAQQGSESKAAIVHRGSNKRVELELDVDFRPLAIGDSGPVDAPLAFVGYGITAPELNYDDYADLDAAGKVVIVLRHEPQQSLDDSVFNGTDHSSHAPFRRKVRNALDHNAAAIVFCTDEHEMLRLRQRYQRRLQAVRKRLDEEQNRFAELEEPTSAQRTEHQQKVESLRERIELYTAAAENGDQQLLPFEGAGMATSGERLPVLFASRAAVDRLLAAAERPNLASLEAEIDRQFEPQSFDLEGWRMDANVDIARQDVPIKNVIAVLEGEGPLADESIVIGAHYDHLGRGRTSATGGEIHNGADDNASGTALLLEMAAHYASLPTPPPRRMVFIAFTGEESGLLGSAHYVTDPVVPLESTIAMFNFDMVGRLTENRLVLSGTDTAAEFSQWVDEVNERHGFDLVKVPGGLGPSDHASFYAKQVPVLHFFTGLHTEYHRPSDDVHLLNVPGMRRVYAYAREMVDLALESPEPPTYTETDGPSNPK